MLSDFGLVNKQTEYISKDNINTFRIENALRNNIINTNDDKYKIERFLLEANNAKSTNAKNTKYSKEIMFALNIKKFTH